MNQKSPVVKMLQNVFTKRMQTTRTTTRRTICSRIPSSTFLDSLQNDVRKELQKYPDKPDILSLPADARNALGVARALQWRIETLDRNNHCRRCWLHQTHCICHQCPPLPPLPKIHRIFLLMHHKEIALAVDTAKLIMAAYPDQCRLVVGGLENQPSLQEMQLAMKRKQCLVLFPTDESKTFQEICQTVQDEPKTSDNKGNNKDEKWDIVVLDGTWAQARRLYTRYIPPQADGGPPRVQLSDKAIDILSSMMPSQPTSDNNSNSNSNSKRNAGHQLRRHPTFWRQVSTLEATRLLLGDILGNEEGLTPWDALSTYQQIGDLAATTQLGSHQVR